jgi:hypothetical protein
LILKKNKKNIFEKQKEISKDHELLGLTYFGRAHNRAFIYFLLHLG